MKQHLSFNKKILAWYAQHGRQTLPWKNPCTPYRVWLAEIMLQQTQVSTVIPYFHKFLNRFPTLQTLAQSPLDDVLAHWAGLGYYARARNLHKTAKIVVEKFNGEFPQDLATLMSLPGIGRSTAGAILAQAFEIRAPILDGNVKRVLWRFHGDKIPANLKAAHTKLWHLAEKYTPQKSVGAYTQAIMDLGALICTRSAPHCSKCPIQAGCYAFKHHTPTAFPPKQIKKPLPTHHVHMLCVVNHKQEILLEKRSQQGIWGGLFSLPEFTDEVTARKFLSSHYPTFSSFEPFISLPHTFTHFHLIIHTSLVQFNKVAISLKNPTWQWVALAAVTAIGLPTPIKKIIKHVTIRAMQLRERELP